MGRRVSLVLITFNSARYLPACLDALARPVPPLDELLIIDNASSDGSAELVARLLPGARLIRNGENSGFSAAANQGIRDTSGDYVLLLNPDVALSPEYVARLVDALESAGPSFGAATGKLLRAAGDAIDPTGRIDSKGIRMTRSGRHFDIEADEPDRDDDATFEVFGVSGAAALYRRSFLDDVAIDGEIFDTDFFVYREDADLSWRGQLFGWRALCCPAAVALHVRRVTPERRGELPPEINMHSVKNRFLLRMKNEGFWLAVRNAPGELLRDLIVIGAALTIERSSLPGLKWVWKHRDRVLAKRRLIQARRKVSDRELAKWFR